MSADTSARSRGGELLLTVLVGAVAVLAQLPLYDRWLAFLDEGYILAIADEINHGRIPYRDVTIDAPFPGAFYLLAGWFRVAGTSVRSSRVLALATFALMVVAVFRIARELLPRAWAFGVVGVFLAYRMWAFPHWHIFNYSPVAATLLLCATAAVLAYLRTERRWVLFAGGVAAGLGLLAKQDYGVAVSACLGAALLVTRGRRAPASLVVLVAGAVVAVVPMLAYLASEGALADLVQDTLLLPLSGAVGYSFTRLPAVFPLFRQDPALRAAIGNYLPSVLATLRWPAIYDSWLWRETAVWDVALKVVFYSPFVVFLAALASTLWPRRRGARSPVDAQRLVLLAVAGGFLLAFNRPRDWVHLMMVFPPVILLAATMTERALRRAPRAVARAVQATLVLGVVVLLAEASSLALDLRRAYAVPLDNPRCGVLADPVTAALVTDVVGYMTRESAPGETLPVYPIQPMLGFLAARPAAAGYYFIFPVQDPRRDERIIAALEGGRVAHVVYGLSHYVQLGSFQQTAPRLFDYLARHYVISAVFSPERFGPLMCALTRREAPATSTDPPGEWAPADVFAPALWPFTPVVAQRVGTADAPASGRVALDVPATPVSLEFHFGINPDRWLGLSDGPFTFRIADATGDAPAPLFEATLDPARNVADRRWVDASVDLSPFRGRHVNLAFAITAPGIPLRPLEMAGWAEPRLVARPDEVLPDRVSEFTPAP